MRKAVKLAARATITSTDAILGSLSPQQLADVHIDRRNLAIQKTQESRQHLRVAGDFDVGGHSWRKNASDSKCRHPMSA